MSAKNENEIENDNQMALSNHTPKKEFAKKVGNYILTEQIGLGTFSKVTKAIHILTGEKVAIKILDKSEIKDNIDMERISREIEILKSISHPNISQLYESNSTIHNFYLVMEYLEGGDLCDFINKNICLNEHIACHFFRQLISAIEYLSEMGITHRDIKPENILLDSSQNNIKLIDFGLSNYCAEKELLQSACGSPCFASPEMLSGNPYNGITTDIWSSGIVLYSMLVGTLPFDDQELNVLYDQIKIGTFYIPSTLSLEAIDFLKRILYVEPDKRLSLKQIKEHPWFNLEKNKLNKGIDLTMETFPYDENLIEYVIKNYYEDDIEINKSIFIKMVQYHACNQYTATYYLTQKLLENNKENNNSNIESKNKNELVSNNNSSNDNENKNKKEDIEINLNDKNKNENLKEEKELNTDYISSFKTQTKISSHIINKNESKEKKSNSNNSANNIYKGKNLINNNNNLKNENQKISIIKKEIISYKKSPDNDLKIKKINTNKRKIKLDNNKKLTDRISNIFDYIKNFKYSVQTSSNKKTKSWQKKEKIKRTKNEKKKIKNIYDKNKITRNNFHNYATEYNKKQDIKSSYSNNQINNIRFAGTFMNKHNMSLTERIPFSNSIFSEDQKVLSFNNSKMNSIKTENISKNKNSPNNKQNISNLSKNSKYEKNSVNISKKNCANKKNKKYNKKKIDLNLINNEKNSKFPKISSNKYNNKKILFQSNINYNFKKINANNKNYVLTENNYDKKDSKFNKIKFPESTRFSIHIKKIIFNENKNIKSNNTTINKYKGLIDEFKLVNSENKTKKNKLKKMASKLENEYFISVNQRLGEKNKIRNRNISSFLVNPSLNHSLSKGKTLTSISNNFVSQNCSNNLEDFTKKPKIKYDPLKNKQKLVINNDKFKLLKPFKYKKNNLKININSINSNLNKNNNILELKMKNKRNINYKTHRKNSSYKKECLTFTKPQKAYTNKNSTNKSIKNPFSQNLSLSPENSKNNIKNIDNKKIINININNILKINKKYSISLNKSNDSSKRCIYFNNNNEVSELKNMGGVKNNNSGCNLVYDGNNIKYKGAIKYLSNNYTCKKKNEVFYPHIRNEQRNIRNYSSMLKRQLFEEQFFNKNKRIYDI